LAATKRPTCCNRVGSDGNALHNSVSGDRAGWAMKQMLHTLPFGATYETRCPGPPKSRDFVP
jgi:hypothetical protein